MLESLGYCGRCGRDIDASYCDHCQFENDPEQRAMLVKDVRAARVRVVPPRAVLVDLDALGLRPWQMKWRLMQAGYRVRSMRIYRSTTKRHRHVVFTVSPRPRTLIEVIALQLLCGSDPAREANNLRRARTPTLPRWAMRTQNRLYHREEV